MPSAKFKDKGFRNLLSCIFILKTFKVENGQVKDPAKLVFNNINLFVFLSQYNIKKEGRMGGRDGGN